MKTTYTLYICQLTSIDISFSKQASKQKQQTIKIYTLSNRMVQSWLCLSVHMIYAHILKHSFDKKNWNATEMTLPSNGNKLSLILLLLLLLLLMLLFFCFRSIEMTAKYTTTCHYSNPSQSMGIFFPLLELVFLLKS